MTVQEFDEKKDSLSCQTCGHTGLTTERNPNNNGIFPVCPQCGSKTPVAGVQYLRQRTKTPPRKVHDTREVWRLNGDHCTFCAKDWDLCERLGIGRTAQHVMPFYKGGDEWPVVPFCARCQQASAAAIEETRRIAQQATNLRSIIERIETKFPELKGDLLS